MLYIRTILDYNDSSYQKEANKEYIINKDKWRWKVSQQSHQNGLRLKFGYTLFYTSILVYMYNKINSD